jgi:DNA-directed RNA polymerase specialized sigma24 family protein
MHSRPPTEPGSKGTSTSAIRACTTSSRCGRRWPSSVDRRRMCSIPPRKRRCSKRSEGGKWALSRRDLARPRARRSALSFDPAEQRFAEGVRAGDEVAFTELVRRHGPTMLRLAQAIVGSRAVAEEVVQDASIAVLAGVDRFQGRSSLKTSPRGTMEAAWSPRWIPIASSAREQVARALGLQAPSFADVPEERLLAKETRDQIEAAPASLLSAQRLVVTCATSRGGARTRSARHSPCRPRTSASFSTADAPRLEPASRRTSHRRRP